MKKTQSAIYWIAFWVITTVILCFALEFVTDYFKFGQARVFRSVGLLIVAVITFYGTLRAGIGQDGSIEEGDIRTAITISIVTVYLVLIAIVAFYSPIRVDPQNTQQAPQLSPITDAMITSFTAIVAIVIPFYFGTSAYVQVKREEAQMKNNPIGD